MTPWLYALIVYVVVALVSLVPVLKAWKGPVLLNPGGPSFSDSLFFSDEAKQRLAQNFERLRGTLGFWKHEALKYELTHIYCMLWLIGLSISVPVLTQITSHYAKEDEFSSVFLTVATTHVALVTSVHKFFKVEQNFKAFRLGESEFYDTYRRLLDSPDSFGKTETEQIASYFEQVSAIRKSVRGAETDTYAGLEEIRRGQTERQSTH